MDNLDEWIGCLVVLFIWNFFLVEISSFDLQVIDYNLNYTVAKEMYITASLVFGVYKTVYLI